jgi:hypothetical protein
MPEKTFTSMITNCAFRPYIVTADPTPAPPKMTAVMRLAYIGTATGFLQLFSPIEIQDACSGLFGAQCNSVATVKVFIIAAVALSTLLLERMATAEQCKNVLPGVLQKTLSLIAYLFASMLMIAILIAKILAAVSRGWRSDP